MLRRETCQSLEQTGSCGVVVKTWRFLAVLFISIYTVYGYREKKESQGERGVAEGGLLLEQCEEFLGWGEVVALSALPALHARDAEFGAKARTVVEGLKGVLSCEDRWRDWCLFRFGESAVFWAKRGCCSFGAPCYPAGGAADKGFLSGVAFFTRPSMPTAA